MTLVFDETARKNRNRFLNFFEEQTIEFDTKAKDLKVRIGTVKEVREYIASYHYSKTMPDSTTDVFVGYYGGIFAGTCIFGMGASITQYKSIIPFIQDGEYRELTRLWSPDGMPKNTESKLISESIRLLPKNVKLLLSFADPSKGHLGKIYQATNWDYCGMSGGGKRLIDSNGNQFHVRLISIYKKRHPELSDKTNEEIMNLYGWKYLQDVGKHRYVKVLGNKREVKYLKSFYKDKILKYPTI